MHYPPPDCPKTNFDYFSFSTFALEWFSKSFFDATLLLHSVVYCVLSSTFKIDF